MSTDLSQKNQQEIVAIKNWINSVIEKSKQVSELDAQGTIESNDFAGLVQKLQ